MTGREHMHHILVLRGVGEDWARARQDERQTAEKVYECIRAAHADGVPETQIARALGVNRMTVRKALGK
jgi:DNA invertase Pin-like site-specific DNA recombinase